MLKRRRTLMYLLTGVVVVAAGGFALAYFVLFPTSSPDKFTLTEPDATVNATSAARDRDDRRFRSGGVDGRERLAGRLPRA